MSIVYKKKGSDASELSIIDVNDNFTSDNVEGALEELNTQVEDIKKEIITTEERTKLNNLENYDDTEIKNDIQVQKSRIDTFTTLQDGSTTGDAELIDGRIGANGITYKNIGGAIRGQFSEINSALDYIAIKSSNLYDSAQNEIGVYISESGTKYSNNEYFISGFIPVNNGDKIWFNHEVKFVNGYDKNKNHISRLGTNVSNLEITDESVTYIIFTGHVSILNLNIMINKGDYLKQYEEPNLYTPIDREKVLKNTNDINEINKTLDNMIYFSPNLANPSLYTKGAFINDSGKINASSDYFITDFIKVTPGIMLYKSNYSRFSSFYDENKTFIRALENQVPGVFEIPNDVYYIRFTFRMTNIDEIMICESNVAVDYEPYGYQIKDSVIPKVIKKLNILDNSLGHLGSAISLCGNDALKDSIESLNANTIFSLKNFPQNLKKGISMTLHCKFNTFSGICFGKGYKQYRGDWIEVNNTNVIWKHSEGTNDSNVSIKETVVHNLTIEKFLSISIYIDNDSLCRFSINTLTGTFSHSFQWNYEMNGLPFVFGEQDLTDVQISSIPNDAKKPMWLFGDSYFGVANNRVIGQLKNLGFTDNVLIHGLAGQNPSQAYNELLNCLHFGTPKYIIWCLGMNGDNETYNDILTKLKNKCYELNIILILMVIPTIPSRDKETIKDIIINSGCRYVNAYDAVGANSNGDWYDGYLSSDGIHPTEMGAKAIAMRMIIDVPEIMQYGYSSKNVSGDISGDL